MRKMVGLLTSLVLSGCLSSSTVSPNFHPGVPRLLPADLRIVYSGNVVSSLAIGYTLVGGTLPIRLELANRGLGPARNLAAEFSTSELDFLGGSFPGTGGTCDTTILPDGDCSVVVAYAPLTEAVLAGAVTFSFRDEEGAKTETLNLEGNSRLPGILAVSDSPSFDFGDVLLDIGTEKVFTLSNTGSTEITALQVTGLASPFVLRGAYPGVCGDCSATLAVGATCTLAISYRPQTATTHSATIAIEYESGVQGEAFSIGLTGTAIDPDDIVPGPPDPDDFPPADICR